MAKQSKIFSLENVSVKLNGKPILQHISFDVDQGDWCMLLGPNGAGKSTLIYALAKSAFYDGKISLIDTPIENYNNVEYAKNVGFLSQKNLVAYDFSVYEVVAMGRYCHHEGLFKNLDETDNKKIDEAIKATGLVNLRDRSVQELSGGEVQRTFLAQVLAQDPRVLVLDEPTNNLDLVYQQQIFDLIQNWIKEKKGTVISVVHDLGLAKTYGNKAVLLDNGNLVANGKIDEVLTSQNLDQVYKINVAQYLKKLYSNFV